MKRLIVFALTLGLACLLLLAMASAAWADITVNANHDHVDIRLNYHGSTVSVRGNADPGTDIILTISTEGGEEKLMKKDKIGGFIWMNREKLTFENIPEIYLIRSTKEVGQLLDSSEQAESGIGYDAIAATAEVDPSMDAAGTQSLLDDFFLYKESKNLYSSSVGGIDLNDEGGTRSYYTLFDWPYQVPPGEYKVMAYEVKDGQVLDSAEAQVTVAEAGVVKRLADLAQNNGALYGIIAIVVALAAGFGVGMIFKGGGAH